LHGERHEGRHDHAHEADPGGKWKRALHDQWARDLLGQGLQDVVVQANGANGVVTDANGNYAIPNLRAANTYTMTPLLYGYTFGGSSTTA